MNYSNNILVKLYENLHRYYSMEDININEILENAKRDPSLFSTLDIDALLESIENDKNDYLENKTMADVTNTIFEMVNSMDLSIIEKGDICKKLVGYRLVDEIHELHKGKHVRWISKRKLTNGGIVMDIKFLDNGVHVLCKNSQNRFIQYKFDNSPTFQKLSVEEQLILMAYEHI